MKRHLVRVARSEEGLAREEQLAWKLALLANDVPPIDRDVEEMVVNRVIDNAGVAAAALARPPVAHARAQSLAHPYAPGATVFGCALDRRCSPEWAAWANSVAVRELDFHDTFLAAEFSHPGDNIPPLLAVAQHRGLDGSDLLAAIVTAYEVHIDLAAAICLYEHRIDHIAHLGPSVAAGLGTLLHLPVEVTYQAIQQALHTTTTTRQSRKGEISSWKAYAPAFAGKMAIEAVDRAMRGEGAPSPIYEGDDGVIAWLLDGPEGHYEVALPEPSEARRAILDSYTKAYSAEYQSQAIIDLALRLRSPIEDPARIDSVVLHTSHHTHEVIGSGANDPQKLDPDASRETLDHSAMYAFAVALEDGSFHHERSYTSERAHRASTVALWHKVSTVEDPEWTRRYHSADLKEKAFGARAVVTFVDGSVLEDELAVADAHPLGAHPFGRDEYRAKFAALADGILAPEERDRFLSLAERLASLSSEALGGLSFAVAAERLGPAGQPGLFETGATRDRRRRKESE